MFEHVFAADLDKCRRCGGPMRWAEVASTPDAIARRLAAHGFGPQLPPSTHEPPPGQRAASSANRPTDTSAVSSG
jgi:hypothetical protein